MNRRRFMQAAGSGLLLPPLAHAGLITQSGPRLFAEPDGGGGDLLFAMDYSGNPEDGGGWPAIGGSAGYGGDTTPDFVAFSRIAGGGPSGQDCYRWTWVPNDTEIEGSLGFHSGNNFLTSAVWPAGATMWFSFRMRYTAGSTPPDGPKVIMLTSQDQGGGLRPILQVQNTTSGFYVWRMAMGGGGGEATQTPTPKAYSAGTWERVQWAVTASTTTSATDGRQRIWLDNNVEALPTVTWSDILVPPPDDYWNGGISMYYSNLPVGLQCGIEMCDFQIRTGFRVMS